VYALAVDEQNRYQNFPSGPGEVGHRKAVCRRCRITMDDSEPCSRHGEFYHPRFDKGKAAQCPNQGQTFTAEDREAMPFVRKAVRRHLKRHGQRL